MVNVTVESNFINGLVTEATALNFPENACTDTDNCIFHPKGEVYRRYGLDYEPGYESHAIDRTGKATASFFWQNASSLAAKNFIVSQVGSVLYFYDASSTAVSSELHSSSVDFSTFSSDIDTTLCGKYPCQFSTGQGYLIVVNAYSEPFYVKYNVGTDNFTATEIEVTVRDTKGVDEGGGLVWDSRPAALTDIHKYNLWNQGWTEQILGYLETSLDTVLNLWHKWRPTDYPSNSDVWWMFKDGFDNYNYAWFDKIKRGNTPAPKGHYTFSAWNIDRNSIVTGIENETSGSERPRTTAFFAGRAWFAGAQSQGYGSRVYYSQTVKSPLYFGTCHQLNDPTNQYLFSLLATDGGTIDIIDCGLIINLVPFQNMLMVFATNGIWAITGNQGIGFTPTDFAVKKLSSVPALSNQAFVDVDGVPIWWNNDGIYTVQVASPQLGTVEVVSMTEKTIRTFYNDIPTENKQYVQGAYNPLTRQVQWVYRYRPITDFSSRYEYDRALTYNIISKAFYPWTFPHKEVKVTDVICLPTYGTSLVDVPARNVDGDIELDDNGEPTYTRELTTSLMAAVFKYQLSFTESSTKKLTFGETCDTDYVDFKTFDSTGHDFTSFAVSGYALPGKANRKAQETYIKVFCSNQDPSMCTFIGIWDYSNSIQSGRYTQPQTVEFFEGAKRRYYFRRLKVRGNGTTLQLKFTSITGKPFNLSGWARDETVNKAA